MRFSQLILWLCLTLATVPAFGQAVVLRPEDALPRLKAVSPNAFYINGHTVYGLSEEATQSYYMLGDTAKYIMALVALRLADQRIISLDEPIAKTLPELMEFNPFEVAITPRHLLTETAGFAQLHDHVDLDTRAVPLRYFLIKKRGAGQIAVNDPFGWQLLKSFLERKTGQTLVELVRDQILAPLAVDEIAFKVAQPESPQYTPLALHHIRGDGLAKVFTLLAQNTQSDGQPYLEPITWGYLTAKPLWQFHPLGPARLAGLQLIRKGSHFWIENSETDCFFAPKLVAFPLAGIVFVLLPSNKEDIQCNVFSAIAARTGTREIPPNWDSASDRHAANQLVPATTLNGLYNCAETPSGVASRITLARTCHLEIETGAVHGLLAHETEDSITVTTEFSEQAPYAYVPKNTRHSLFFSPYRAGGYAMVGGQAYVRVGMLGYLQTKVEAYIPLMIVILLTGALHISSRTSVQWRRFGWFCLAGVTLVGVGLYADWHWWPTVLYELQQPWLIALWRTGLNVGLMLLLALPMLSLTFIRQQNMPEKGLALLFAGPHLGLISLAAIGLFLTTIIWGMAGTFTAY